MEMNPRTASNNIFARLMGAINPEAQYVVSYSENNAMFNS